MPDLPRLGFGTASIGNLRRAQSDEEARALLQSAWDAGIRHFDTAPHYGLGLAETRLGDFLADKPRHEYVVTTKVGRLLEPAAADDARSALDDEGFVVPAVFRRRWDFTKDGVRRSLHQSLERLGLDHVDVAYLHDPERWDLDRALRDGLAGLETLRSEDLASAIGVASMDARSLREAGREGPAEVLMVAGRHTLATPDLDTLTLDRWLSRGIKVVAAAVLNGGLTGDTMRHGATFDYGVVPGALRLRVDALRKVCRDYDVSLRMASLQYPLRHRAVVSVMLGGETMEQVAQNVGDLGGDVPEMLWNALTISGLLRP